MNSIKYVKFVNILFAPRLKTESLEEKDFVLALVKLSGKGAVLQEEKIVTDGEVEKKKYDAMHAIKNFPEKDIGIEFSVPRDAILLLGIKILVITMIYLIHAGQNLW